MAQSPDFALPIYNIASDLLVTKSEHLFSVLHPPGSL